MEHLGPNSVFTTCPYCGHYILTYIGFRISWKTHFFALCLCAFCCWCCAPIPYCLTICKDASHFCPNCHSFIGKVFGPTQQSLKCQQCQTDIQTKLKAQATTKTHLIALLLCCLGCWPCICLPYYMDSCQNMDHYCPHCEVYLGTCER